MELGLVPWLSSLIAGAVGFVIAGILATVGMRRLRAAMLMPDRTINQLHHDAATMKARLQGNEG